MMNYDRLNEMVGYIEDHLTEEIDNKKLSEIVGISGYSLQRIFTFLTGVSISEYIRKRRLSRAFEDLKTSDAKVIDLAVKYGYDSPVSFSRAFKKYFGMTPGECRDSGDRFMLFPMIRFADNNSVKEEMSYEIRDIGEKVLHCYKVSAQIHEDFLYKIRALYRRLEDEGILEKLEKQGVYGISIVENDEYTYYAGSELELPDTEEYIITPGRCAVFAAGSDSQKDIVKVYDFVYGNWITSSSYEIADIPDIEYYTDGNCYIYFKIKNKTDTRFV